MSNCKKILSIIVVSYNTRELTINCLKSVQEQSIDLEYEIIVIDNASSDGSANLIEKKFPQVHLIRSDQNLGFARANNIAAADAHGDYLLLLNPDTVILDKAVNRLVKFAIAHPNAKVWGGRTVFGDGTLNHTSCWRFMSLWSLFTQALGLTTLFRGNGILNREAYGGWERDRVCEVDIISGCFFLIERTLWDVLGGFDEQFFMYAEENDLCFRARKRGARALFTPDATIIHYGGASEGLRSGKLIKLFSGKMHFIKKHWPRYRQVIAVNLFKVHTLIRLLAYHVLAALRRSSNHAESAGVWSAVWSARKDWESGYS